MPKDFWSRANDQLLQWQIDEGEMRWLIENRDRPSPSLPNLPESKIVDLLCRQFNVFLDLMESFSDFRHPFGKICLVQLGERTFTSLKHQRPNERAFSLAELCATCRGPTAELAAWGLAGVLTPKINKSVLRRTRHLSGISPWFQAVTAFKGDRLKTVRALLERRKQSHGDLLHGIESLTLQLDKIIMTLDQLFIRSNGLSRTRNESGHTARVNFHNISGAESLHSSAASQTSRSIPTESSPDVKAAIRNPKPRLKIFSEIEEFIGDFGTISRQHLGRETVQQLVRLRRRQRAMRLIEILNSPMPEVRIVALLSLLSIYSPEIHKCVCMEVGRMPQLPMWFGPLRDYDGDLHAIDRAVLKECRRHDHKHPFALQLLIRDLDEQVGSVSSPARSQRPEWPR